MRKSHFKGFLFTLLFGPIGLFYSSKPLGLLFSVLAFVVGSISLALAVLFWPISIFAGAIAIKRFNSKGELETEKVVRRVMPKTTEEELAHFSIAPSSPQTKRPQKKSRHSAKWIRPGQKVHIGMFTIQGGLIYVGRELERFDGRYMDNDSSLVDLTLKTDFRSPDYAGDQMGYWPSYRRITPQSRAAYIEWLASDRSNPETYIGYVFIYFYGLERRLIFDDPNGEVSDDERKTLIQELERLRSVYGHNRSFSGYVSALLSHVWVINHKYIGEQPDSDLLVARRDFTSVFKFLLAKAVGSGKPVDEQLALAWVKSHPEFTLRTPARRCPEEFDTLFKMRYRCKYGDGLEITPNRTRLKLEYRPASASLTGFQGVRLDLPDASRLNGPVKKLIDLAESCTGELDSFSRFVGRPENSRDSLSALSLLPNDLIAALSNPRIEELKDWMGTQVLEFQGLVSVESLLSQFGEVVPSKVNKKEAEVLSNIVEKVGFGIAPDLRFHQAKPDIYGKIVLFAGGHGNNFTTSSEFRKVGTILRLGTLVAAIDEHVSDSEVSVLNDLIFLNYQLSETEKRSLHAYMIWRLNTPPNMTGLKKRLDALSGSEKVAISYILIGVALADGKIEPAEINQLEKLYLRLGLDKAMVASDIHNLSSNRLPRPDRAGKSSSGTSTQPASSFALNRDLLRLLEEETKEAQSVLESIFTDADFIEESEIEAPTAAPTKNGAIPGLDSKCQELYFKLITKSEWTHEEMEGFCDGLQLMTDGAVESLNDWAFDNVGASLIEDGSTVYVDIELAEEIAALQTQEP